MAKGNHNSKYNKPRLPLPQILNEAEDNDDEYFGFSFEEDIQNNKFNCRICC